MICFQGWVGRRCIHIGIYVCIYMFYIVRGFCGFWDRSQPFRPSGAKRERSSVTCKRPMYVAYNPHIGCMLWQRLVHDLPAGYENIWKISHTWELSLIGCNILWSVRDAWALDNFPCRTEVDTSPEVSNVFHKVLYRSNSDECSSKIHRPHSHGDLFSVGLPIKGNSCIPWFICLLYCLTVVLLTVLFIMKDLWSQIWVSLFLFSLLLNIQRLERWKGREGRKKLICRQGKDLCMVQSL